jgi:hypothetical protein
MYLPKRIVKFQIFFIKPTTALDLVSILIAELVTSIFHGSYSIGPIARHRFRHTDVNLVSWAKLGVLAMTTDQ